MVQMLWYMANGVDDPFGQQVGIEQGMGIIAVANNVAAAAAILGDDDVNDNGKGEVGRCFPNSRDFLGMRVGVGDNQFVSAFYEVILRHGRPTVAVWVQRFTDLDSDHTVISF